MTPATSLLRPERRPDLFELLFSSSGRLSRAPFLAGEALVLGCLWLYDGGVRGAWRLLSGWAVLFALLFAGCCLVARRLHDLGRSGWWTGLVWLLFLFAWPEPLGRVGWAARAVLLVVGAGLAVTPGGRAANRFGPALTAR